MSKAHLIALVGFDPFENTTFESFFRLATRRDPGYDITADQTQADLVILNSNDRDALVAGLKLRRPGQRVLLIGPSTHPAASGLPVHPRPIRFMAVLSAVENLLAEPLPVKPLAAAAPARPTPPARPAQPDFAATQTFEPSRSDDSGYQGRRRSFAATEPFAPLQPEAGNSSGYPEFAATQPFAPLSGEMAPPPVVMPRPVQREDLITAESLMAYQRPSAPSLTPAEVPAPAAPVQVQAPVQAPAAATPVKVATPSSEFHSTAGFLGIGSVSAPVTPTQSIEDVLVIDDSDVALKFMQNRLGRLGFRVAVARSGAEGLDAVGNRSFRYVFVDVMMDGMDGFQTCRAIKKRSYTVGKAPVVFLLSGRGGVIDKMRGSLAGADAYLTKPLNEAELKVLLAKYDAQVKTSYAATRVANPASVPASRGRP